jgi:hypothetical protein
MTSIPDIKLISNDGVVFKVPVNIANLSNFVAIMTCDEFPNDLDNITEYNLEDIPVPSVNAEMLELIIKFMEHHAIEPMVTIEKPLLGYNIGDNVQKWYALFIMNIPNDMLYHLINSANYMHIQPLLELSCAQLACLINNKTTTDIDELLYM